MRNSECYLPVTSPLMDSRWRRLLLVSERSRRKMADRSPNTNRVRLILPFRVSLSEFLHRPPAPRLATPKLYLSRVSFPFATSPEASTSRDEKISLRSALRLSQSLDGLLRFPDCGRVSSRSHAWDFSV
jgi:hypothetical protein